MSYQGLRKLKQMVLLSMACTAISMLVGCASSLPQNVDRPVSSAWSRPQDTKLGQLAKAARSNAKARADSAFYLLAAPQDAFLSRVSLVDAAERSLDLQYYAIHADQSSAALIHKLQEAARKGVRVRVLLDDFHSTGPDAQVMRLAFEPNIEMRMFNPLAGPRNSMLGRTFTLLTDFQRAQQRMHNKLFIADNAMAVMGGRNLGDEYFDASNSGNFVDIDVLTAGSVVQGLSQSFDSYWNNPRAYPVQTLVSAKELHQLKLQFSQEDKQATHTPATTPEPSSAHNALASDFSTALARPSLHGGALDLRKIPWIWASASVLADRPTKVPLEDTINNTEEANQRQSAADGARPKHSSSSAASQQTGTQAFVTPASSNKTPGLRSVVGADSVVDGLLTLIRSAKHDLLIISPYFVPGKEIIQAFEQARQRNVRIRVLTNSLASNDAPLAHAGYARHRVQLLTQGVDLYEMLSTRASVGSVLHSGSTGGSSATGASRAMLHSKLLVIDNQLTVIGSMNLDMRSQYQNTEIAVLIGSHTLSAKATEVIEAGLRDGAWRVQLTDDKRLIWVAPPDGDRQNQTTEPDASLGLRLMLQLLGPLAPDSLL